MTDCELVLEILKDGKPHGVLEIMQRGKPGCANWAVRTRISNLRDKGYKITKYKIGKDRQAIYQLEQIFDGSGQRLITA